MTAGNDFRPVGDGSTAAAEARRRGSLKLFLGYAPGVGKTAAMLRAAGRRQEAGTDIVVACLDQPVAAGQNLVPELETIPFSTYQLGDPTTDIDLDAVLARHPALVIVDNLASANSEFARHWRRYQDVEELLDVGIDVFTALDVQHLESVGDIVQQITGVVTSERVPDRILDQADAIEVVDLPPEELLTRLEQGRVNTGGMLPDEVRQFFRLGNLYALRELALRRASDHVDQRMRAYMQQRAISGPWAATERLLVCVGPDLASERLVRTAQRLARELNAEWFAVSVKTPEQDKLSLADRERMWSTLQFAGTLGAQILTLSGSGVADRIIQFARKQNITKIIVGGPSPSKWRRLVSRSTAVQLMRRSREIDVMVVSRNGERAPEVPESRPARGAGLQRYFYGTVLVLASTFLSFPIDSFLAPTNLVMLYLVAVVIAAAQLGFGPAVLTAFLSVLSFDYFFVPPRLTLEVADTEYLLTFAGFLIVGAVISRLVSEARAQTDTAQQREEQTATLYTLSRGLSVSADLESITETVVNQVRDVFACEAVILLEHSAGLDVFPSRSDIELSLKQREVMTWAFEHGRPAGQGTATFSSFPWHCLPLSTPNGVVGVLALGPAKSDGLLTPEQIQLIDAFVSQASLAVERQVLVEKAQQTEVLKATEAFQAALLNSISHDLRTPLVSITGALSGLREALGGQLSLVQGELVDNAYEESRRLNDLVGSLLDMTRIEGGALRVNRELCDVEDLLGAAMAPFSERLDERPVTVNIEAGMPLVALDFVLMTQALGNLVDNALKHSPPTSPIELSAKLQAQDLLIRVSDEGPGIGPRDAERIFEKFFRGRGQTVHGVGLGLSIARGFVEVQGGQIWAENRPEGGTAFWVRLPAVMTQTPDSLGGRQGN